MFSLLPLGPGLLSSPFRLGLLPLGPGLLSSPFRAGASPFRAGASPFGRGFSLWPGLHFFRAGATVL